LPALYPSGLPLQKARSPACARRSGRSTLRKEFRSQEPGARRDPLGERRVEWGLVAEALGDVSDDAVWRVMRKHDLHLDRRQSGCVSTEPEFSREANRAARARAAMKLVARVGQGPQGQEQGAGGDPRRLSKRKEERHAFLRSARLRRPSQKTAQNTTSGDTKPTTMSVRASR
jgi:hypothetical protein